MAVVWEARGGAGRDGGVGCRKELINRQKFVLDN